jgi:hypothetical protein
MRERYLPPSPGLSFWSRDFYDTRKSRPMSFLASLMHHRKRFSSLELHTKGYRSRVVPRAYHEVQRCQALESLDYGPNCDLDNAPGSL